jgi:hypothetical protein
VPLIAHSGHADIPDGLFDGNYPKPTLSVNIDAFIDEFLLEEKNR